MENIVTAVLCYNPIPGWGRIELMRPFFIRKPLSENLYRVMKASPAHHEIPIQQSTFFLPIELTSQRVACFKEDGIICVRNSFFVLIEGRGQPNG